MGNTQSTPVSVFSAAPPAARASLAAATLAAGYVLSKAMTPPRPLSLETSHGDRMSTNANLNLTIKRAGFTALTIYRRSIILAVLLNTAAILAGPERLRALLGKLPPALLRGDNVAGRFVHINGTLLSWNSASATALCAVMGAGLARLAAMGQLGRDFRFDLHEPEAGLKTDGMYAWLQHPSYTSGVLMCIAAHSWFSRADGAVGGLLPRNVWDFLRTVQGPAHAVGAVLAISGLRVRVLGEEQMLREKFGDEWERWHARTARFVPFVF